MEKTNKIKYGIKKFYYSEYMPFVVFGIAFFLMICRIQFQDGDDTYFQKKFAQYGIFPFLKQRYLTWSGRMSSELAIGLINFNLPLWKILNSCIAALLMLCISRYATALVENKYNRKIINIIICCAFFTIYPYTVTSGMVWFTGSFFYLWPATALLCALLPFYYALIGKHTIHKVTYLLYFIATAYCCYIEQPLAIFAVFGLLTLIYLKIYKIQISHKLIGQYVFGLFNIIIYAFAPGTRVRAGEELHWYPNYSMLTPIDKLFQAVNWTNKHYITASNLLFLLLTLLIFIVCYIKFKNSSRILLFFISIPLLFLILRIVPFNILFSRSANFQNSTTTNPYQFGISNESTINVQDPIDKLFYNCTTANPGNFNTGVKSLLPSIVCLSVILFIACLLFVAFKENSLKFVSVILYFAALVSGYILAFSPTIFASGSRIFFVGDILILLIIALLTRELLIIVPDIVQKRLFKVAVYVMVAFAGIMFFTYIGTYVNRILWL